MVLSIRLVVDDAIAILAIISPDIKEDSITFKVTI